MLLITFLIMWDHVVHTTHACYIVHVFMRPAHLWNVDLYTCSSQFSPTLESGISII